MGRDTSQAQDTHSNLCFSTDFDDSMFVKTSTPEEWIVQGDYYAKHQCWKVGPEAPVLCKKAGEVWGPGLAACGWTGPSHSLARSLIVTVKIVVYMVLTGAQERTCPRAVIRSFAPSLVLCRALLPGALLFSDSHSLAVLWGPTWTCCSPLCCTAGISEPYGHVSQVPLAGELVP